MARPPSIAKPVRKGKLSRKRLERSGFSPSEIVDLRRKVGQLTGKKIASRELMARLLGASPGSIFNWERGTAPNRHYIDRIRSLSSDASAGLLDLSAGSKNGSNGPAAPATPATLEAASSASSRTFYANDVSVTKGPGETWLRFSLRRPSGRVDVVAELVVPRALLDKLR